STSSKMARGIGRSAPKIVCGGSSWGNYMPPIGKNRYICSFRQRHIYEKPQVVDTKDIRPDKVRNTT
ncbi:hypothetical protein, partial [Bacteroides acidifaciens]|uniref:hypothetical protein n=1 Tax=Bacteroides acidifaciens TaxID=85831 RepID=UPI0025A4EEE6